MGVNGVSHHLAADDLDGAHTMLRLLAFCPPDLEGATGECLHYCVSCCVWLCVLLCVCVCLCMHHAASAGLLPA